MPSIKFYRNMAFALWIPAMAAFVGLQLGMISVTHTIIIGISSAIGEMILLTFVVRKIYKDLIFRDMISSKVSIPKGTFCDRNIRANTNIFEKYIIPTNPMRDCIFRICIELAEKIIGPSLELSVIRTCESGTCEQKFDASHCSMAGTHALHINIYPKEKLNFKFNKDIKVKLFSVEELYIP